MSRPVYEPSLPRTDAQLGYGNRQLFRRPSPLESGGGTTAALLTDWEYDQASDQEVASETWERLGSGGDGARYFQTAWQLDNDWLPDFNEGSIRRNEFALYVCYGSVTFPNALLNGATQIGVGLRFAASATHFHSNTLFAEAEERVDVVAAWWGDLNPAVDLWCWHNAPIPTVIGLADLVARRFELSDDGFITEYGS